MERWSFPFCLPSWKHRMRERERERERERGSLFMNCESKERFFVRPMASFAVEELVGDGVLKEILTKLVEDGWDDVPTLKMMNPEDMDASNMTTRQKDALEIRSYLHNRSLMQYADRLEASGKSLTELQNCNASVLSHQFGMKRGHIARFVDGTAAWGISINSPYRKRRTLSVSTDDSINELSFSSSQKIQISRLSYRSSSTLSDKSVGELRSKVGHSFKGIIASAPAEPRLCGHIRPPPIADVVAPYSMIENTTVEKLAPEYKFGMKPLVKLKTTMRASKLWRERHAVLLCLRRPGLVLNATIFLGASCAGLKLTIAYQFIERNFGDWTPVAEVIEICNRLQQDALARVEKTSHFISELT